MSHTVATPSFEDPMVLAHPVGCGAKRVRGAKVVATRIAGVVFNRNLFLFSTLFNHSHSFPSDFLASCLLSQ